MRSAVVSIDPKTGGVKAYYGGSDANGFDFAQAGLPTGRRSRCSHCGRARSRASAWATRWTARRSTVNGIKITNVEGEGCGTCNIAEALKRSLNTGYYRLMLKLKNGPMDVADAAHRCRHRRELPRRRPHAVRGRQGWPAEQRNRVGAVPVSGARHGVGLRHDRGLGCLPPPALRAEGGQRRGPGAVRRVAARTTPASSASTRPSPTTSPPRCSRSPDGPTATTWPAAAPSAAKTGTNQLGDTGANRDAWMVGFTPSLSTAVWVGTTEGTKPLVNKSGGPVYGSGLPSDIWKATMDGALKGTDNESFPKPTEIGGYAGVPAPPPPPPPARHRRRRRRR